MSKKIVVALVAMVLFAIGLVFYLWQQSVQHEPKPVQTTPVPPQAVNPAPEIPAAPAPTPVSVLPPISMVQSDRFIVEALTAILNNQSLMQLVQPERLIHNIVVTVDNLPQQRVPAKMMPLSAPVGTFLVTGEAGNLRMSPKNAERYSPYVKFAEAIDARKLVALYVRLYPLFQRSYQELGYPNGNFNDRLLETLDDLLDTPRIKGPLTLVQPKFFYQYADPDLENRSIGQKIMLRLGDKNMDRMKTWLLDIKQELGRHEDALGGGR